MKNKGALLDIGVLLLLLLLLLLTPINTVITIPHMLWMGFTLNLAIALPYLIYKRTHTSEIPFEFSLKSGWTKNKIGYILFAVIFAYFLFPFYFASTGAHANWPSARTWPDILLLFIGTNALGIWDELFFINTILRIFRRYFHFWTANILQAILWTIFLYELGFTGWAPAMIFPFALIQGYTYKVYKSLGFIIAIHLAVDFMLFLAIMAAHGNLPFNIFIIR